jgi:N-methylhydantoinase A
MRYVGQGYEITVPVPAGPYGKGSAGALEEAFAARYAALFGQHLPRVAIEVLTWRLRAMGPAPAVSLRRGDAGPGSADAALTGKRPVYFADAGGFVEAAVFARARLGPGAEIRGPAVVEERESTAVIPPGARASVDAQANLVMELPR